MHLLAAEAWMAFFKLQKMLLAEYAPQEEPAQGQEAQPQGGQIPLFSGAPSKVNERQQSGLAPSQEERNVESLVVESSEIPLSLSSSRTPSSPILSSLSRATRVWDSNAGSIPAATIIASRSCL